MHKLTLSALWVFVQFRNQVSLYFLIYNYLILNSFIDIFEYTLNVLFTAARNEALIVGNNLLQGRYLTCVYNGDGSETFCDDDSHFYEVDASPEDVSKRLTLSELQI